MNLGPESAGGGIHFHSGFAAKRQTLEFKYGVRLDGRSAVRRLSRELPDEGADLLEIAVALYAVDRSIPRPPTLVDELADGWGRTIWVEIPVRNPSLWRRNSARLTDLLHWLTDDRWSVEFRQLPRGCGPLDENQGFLFDTVPTGVVPALFSGGLDSTCGLYLDMLQERMLPVSVHTNPWMQHVQRRVLGRLQDLQGTVLSPLEYHVSASSGKSESSQRTRGLLFLAAGVATALAVESKKMRFFENGVGAINLPYLRSQVGSQSTKSSHPLTLKKMADLIAAVTGAPFAIEAPYLNYSKGELISRIPAIGDPVIALSVSCDTGFAARVKNHAPCGTCTSCLLRRQALHSAKRGHLDDASKYRPKNQVDNSNLRAMLWQVFRLSQCLKETNSWTALVRAFPEVLDVVPLVSPRKLVRLYGQYVQEWNDLDVILGYRRSAWAD